MISPTKTKISIVEPSGKLYGSEFCLLDILECLDRQVFSTEVILPRSSPFARQLEKIKIPYYEMLVQNSHGQPRLQKLQSYARLAWRWFQKRPDLIYVNQGGILRPVAFIAKRLRIPVLCQIQTLEDARWVSSLTRYQESVSTFICNSRFIAENTHVPPERRSTVYYGYKWKSLHREDPAVKKSSDRHVVGLLGRISKSKGHYLVAKAACHLKETQSAGFHFRFIGDAPDPDERATIESLVNDFNISDLIEFRGYRHDIAKEFAELDLVIIPSVAEPFGRILCEAAEAQVPVLLADSGGLGELSRHFEVGLRFQPNNVDDFLTQLNYAFENYDEVQHNFYLGAKRVLKALNMQTYIKVIEEIIEYAAAGRATSMSWFGITHDGRTEKNNL